MYYLVKRTHIFVDPHGTPDEGGLEKWVSTNKIWGFIDKDRYYENDLEESSWFDTKTDEELKEYFEENSTEKDDLYGSEDGYNAEYSSFSVKEITAEQFEEYKKIIELYNSI